MSRDIDSKCLSIKELLKENKYIKIPYFQRQYVWKFKTQIKTLIDDLTEDMNVNPGSSYFLGTIIVKYDSKYRLIIDGQQRITTIFLLIAAIYQHPHLNDENKKTITDLLEFFDFDLFNVKNKNLLKNLIYHVIKNISLDNTTSNSNYYCNFLEIQKYLDSHFNEDKINHFFNKLLNFSIITQIEIKNNLNENIIFSKINSTGEELSAYDMFKNDIISSLSFEYKDNKDIDTKIETWNNQLDELTSYLGKDSSLLLRHFIAYTTFNIPNKENKKIFNAYLELKNTNYLVNLDVLLKEYLSFARYYKYLKLNEFKSDLNNNELIIIVSRFNTYAVLLIHIMKQYSYINESNQIYITHPNELKTALRILEYYIISREFADKNEKEITRAIPKILGDIIKQQDQYPAFVASLYANLIYLPQNRPMGHEVKYCVPNEIAIKQGFASTKIYHKNSEFTRLFLIRLLTGDSKIKYDFSNASVEHILPQKYEANWDVSPDEAETYMHTIGNLTLTPYNSVYSNKSFNDKKQEMQNDEFWFNNEIIAKSAWTIDEIKARAIQIFDKFTKIYDFKEIKAQVNEHILLESIAIKHDLLAQKLEYIFKNEANFRREKIDDKTIKSILVKYFSENYSYEKIEETMFNANYRGWIPCAILDYFDIHKPLSQDIFAWIYDHDADIKQLSDILKHIDWYRENYRKTTM